MKESIMLSVCVVAYNCEKFIAEALDSILSQELDFPFQIEIGEDGSTDGTSQAIREEYPQVTVLSGDGHLWWTGSIKLGMQEAITRGFDFIIWLNDDCLVGKNTISELVSFSYKNDRSIIGAIGYER